MKRRRRRRLVMFPVAHLIPSPVPDIVYDPPPANRTTKECEQSQDVVVVDGSMELS